MEKLATKCSHAVPVDVLDELAPCDGECTRKIGTNGWDETCFYEVELSTGGVLFFCEACEQKRVEGLFDE